jgi:DNA-binding NarL/FixJ family response regulator
MSSVQESNLDRVRSLSAREMAVLDLLASGLTNSDIAAHLDVTVHTVKFRLASIYRKLGVANRAQAVGTYLRRAAS